MGGDDPKDTIGRPRRFIFIEKTKNVPDELKEFVGSAVYTDDNGHIIREEKKETRSDLL